MRAAELDEKYEELTKENLPELHELIRPFFLRFVLPILRGTYCQLIALQENQASSPQISPANGSSHPSSHNEFGSKEAI